MLLADSGGLVGLERLSFAELCSINGIGEDGWTDRVVKGIAKTGKPVIGFGIQFTGTAHEDEAAARLRERLAAAGGAAGGVAPADGCGAPFCCSSHFT